MDSAQAFALFYVVPIALWFALLAVLFRVWWSHKLEDSLAFLVFLRERKVLFVSLLISLTVVHIGSLFVRLANGFGWVDDWVALGFGLIASVVGSLIVFLFAWFLLRVGSPGSRAPVVLDLPEHLAYSLGVLDRAEKNEERARP